MQSSKSTTKPASKKSTSTKRSSLTKKTPVTSSGTIVNSDKTLKKKVANLESRLKDTEDKLSALVSVLYSEMKNEMPQGPRSLASRMSKAGLLE